MADDASYPRIPELDVLRSMARRLGTGEALDQREVERALEAGFGALMGFEAARSRALRGSAQDPTAGGAETAALHARIAELSGALTDVRKLSAPPGESRIGFGFVLPQHGQQHHVQRN